MKRLALVKEGKTSVLAITDAGLAHLGQLEHLETLELFELPITDKGLSHLKSLHGLRRLVLCQTLATPAGVQELQKALPECEIVVR